MIDKFSGLKIRKTLNGMRAEDNLPAPPQYVVPLELDENGLPVDFDKLVPVERRKNADK